MRTVEQIAELRWQCRQVQVLGGPIKIEYLGGNLCPWIFSLPAPGGYREIYTFRTFAQCCAAIRRLMAPVEGYTAQVWGHPWYDGTGAPAIREAVAGDLSRAQALVENGALDGHERGIFGDFQEVTR